MEFIRNTNGSVIGIVFDEHPDGTVVQTMIPLVPVPEGAVVGDLPDPLQAADALGTANATIADLQAQLAAAQAAAPPATPPADTTEA